LASVPGYSTVYGAFATVPILMLWMYLGWIIVLMGAVIAAYAPSLQMRILSRPQTPGWRFELALAVLQQLRAVQGGAQRGLSLADVAVRLRTDPLQLEPVLEVLADLDWVQCLDESDETRQAPRWVLLCDVNTTALAPLLDRTLLQAGPATKAFVAAGGLQPMLLAQALGSLGT
jgi:membrane protein